MISRELKFQVVITDKQDYIIEHNLFYPINSACADELLAFIEKGMEKGDVKITRWNAKTGMRV